MVVNAVLYAIIFVTSLHLATSFEFFGQIFIDAIKSVAEKMEAISKWMPELISTPFKLFDAVPEKGIVYNILYSMVYVISTIPFVFRTFATVLISLHFYWLIYNRFLTNLFYLCMLDLAFSIVGLRLILFYIYDPEISSMKNSINTILRRKTQYPGQQNATHSDNRSGNPKIGLQLNRVNPGYDPAAQTGHSILSAVLLEFLNIMMTKKYENK
ncbi:hypothetical protein DI09_4p50 [Mitosporidium daphniae]|uniref:Uncharacterized protein n=1 Tax=Mitosporidium daphniae TaxID=1485682 RepID=A0A098VPF0_9MICR|nr:uncharacterized protein DI09_4p50 [Mitosporidium daphniae]KGG50922.1 hypothetical protein DI09_4p50 [Mitosporidium daphniae]|eukprot:XP_013237402.1 uncharacterized protein DI09_4p50 [Mitosporidium daphniae]